MFSSTFDTNAGCGPFEDDRSFDSLPGYMSPKSPKEDYPARCITKELDEESNDFSCDAADKQVTRLCVCTRKKTKVEASSTPSTLVQ